MLLTKFSFSNKRKSNKVELTGWVTSCSDEDQPNILPVLPVIARSQKQKYNELKISHKYQQCRTSINQDKSSKISQTPILQTCTSMYNIRRKHWTKDEIYFTPNMALNVTDIYGKTSANVPSGTHLNLTKWQQRDLLTKIIE